MNSERRGSRHVVGSPRRRRWAAGGLSAVTGAVLLGALIAPPAAAQSSTHMPVSGFAVGGDDEENNNNAGSGGNECRRNGLDISADIVGEGAYEGTVFRATTDQDGVAFLNDARSVGVWINLDILPNAPECVVDTVASVTEDDGSGTDTAPQLFLKLLDDDGRLYQAVCTVGATPFTATNLAAACGPGFVPVAGTPV